MSLPRQWLTRMDWDPVWHYYDWLLFRALYELPTAMHIQWELSGGSKTIYRGPPGMVLTLYFRIPEGMHTLVRPLYSYEVTDLRCRYMKPGKEGRWMLKDSGEKVVCRGPTFAGLRHAYAALCDANGWPSV